HQARNERRDAIVSNYAMLLSRYGLMGAGQTSTAAVERGEHLEELERKIIAERDQQVRDINAAYERAAAATTQGSAGADREIARRDAEQRRDHDIALAYDSAAATVRQARAG